MMPEAWPSIRSMARCVLPVFVGPRTAFTRAGKPESRPCMDRMFVRRGADCKGFRGLLGLAAISPGALTAIVHLDPMVRRIAAGNLQQTHVRRLSREIPATPHVRYPLSARLTDAGSRSMTVR